MANKEFSALAAQPRLAPEPLSLNGAVTSALAGVEILAINFSGDDENRLAQPLGALPRPARSTKYDQSHLLWAGVGQLFCISEGHSIGEDELADTIEGAGHVTDLSDGWVAVSVAGARAQMLVNHLVMPDLSPESFAIGNVTSTIFAHLRVVIWRNDDESLTLLSAASSAASFWHALTGELQDASRYLELNNA